MSLGSRVPDIGDAFVYYGADVASTQLEKGLTADLNVKNPDWVKLGLEFLGLVISERVKFEINRSVRPPFESIRSMGKERRKKRLR